MFVGLPKRRPEKREKIEEEKKKNLLGKIKSGKILKIKNSKEDQKRFEGIFNDAKNIEIKDERTRYLASTQESLYKHPVQIHQIY